MKYQTLKIQTHTCVVDCSVVTALGGAQGGRMMVAPPVDNTPGDSPGGRYNYRKSSLAVTIAKGDMTDRSPWTKTDNDED